MFRRALFSLFALALPAVVAAQPTTRLQSTGTTGTITANGGTVILRNTGGLAGLAVQATGTYAGTWAVQCATDPGQSTFDASNPLTLALIGSTTTAQSVTNSTGIWQANISGCTVVMVIATAWTSGTLTISMQAITPGGGGGGGGGVLGTVDTEMPSASALANGEANPTVPRIGAMMMVYNGATWDRMTVPAAACDDPARVTSANVSLTAGTGNTELVPLTASQTVFVCGFSLFAGGDSDVIFSYGTGTACATGNTDLATLGLTSTAGLGIAVANGGAAQFKTAASNALCVERGSSVTLKGYVAYVKQ